MAAQPLRSVRYKIGAIIKATRVTVIAISAAGLLGMTLIGLSAGYVIGGLDPSAQDNLRVLQLMTDSETAIRGYQLRPQPDLLASLQENGPALQTSLDAVQRRLGSRSGVDVVVAEQARLVQQWRQDYLTPLASGRIRSLSIVQLDQAKQTFDAFRSVNGRITVWTARQRERVIDGLIIVGVAAALVIIAAGVAGLTVGLRPARRALRGIAPPLEDLHAVVRALQNGDHQARADPTAGVTEIRAVAGALNAAADSREEHDQRLDEQLRLVVVERDWTTALHSLTDLDDVLAASVEALSRGMDVAGVFVRAFEGSSDLPGRGRNATFPVVDNWKPDQALINAVLELATERWKTQQPVVITLDEPAELDREIRRQIVEDFIGRVGCTSMLLAPFGAGEDCLGYIGFGRRPDDAAWSAPEIMTAGRMARTLGTAVVLARIYDREQRAVSQLQDLDARKNGFVSMVSHELRTPLASMIGHLEIIRGGTFGDLPAGSDRSLGAIERNSVRLSTLIEDLLILSRIEEGSRPASMQAVDVAAVVGETVELLHDHAGRGQVEVVASVDVDSGTVLGDPFEIERAITNLLSNAIKFSPAGSRVNVEVSERPWRPELDGEVTPIGTEAGPDQLLWPASAGRVEQVQDVVVITIRDEGMGISDNDQRQLFTRFFRSTNRKAQAIPGTGLGLAIVKLIVERHGGSIRVESALGHGTTMTATLPRQPAPIPAGMT